MSTWDEEIGMWTVSNTPEDPEDVLAREAANLEVEARAAAVAMAVADEPFAAVRAAHHVHDARAVAKGLGHPTQRVEARSIFG